MSSNIKLKVKNLKKMYGQVEIFKNINFEIEKGTFVSILGPSGCGKSTILKTLIGLEALDEGEIIKDGIRINNLLPHERGMGIVFQNYALFPSMTVLENVVYSLKVNKQTRRYAKERSLDILKKVGLIEHLNKKPYELSGGQKQRVAIARTLVRDSDIILLDEALSSLDVENKRILAEEFKSIQKDMGITMIYITHDQEEAFNISDKIIVMSKGRIEQIGTPKEIFNNPANEYVDQFVNKHIKDKLNRIHRVIGE